LHQLHHAVEALEPQLVRLVLRHGGSTADVDAKALDVNQKSDRGFPWTRKSDCMPPSATAGAAMAREYSRDLRVRALAMMEAGESAREAARLLNVGASTTIRWIQRWTTTGSVDAKPGTGHSRWPLERHKQWLLDLVANEPDLALEEIRARLRSEKRQKPTSARSGASLTATILPSKKNSTRRRAGSS
jgi:transposase